MAYLIAGKVVTLSVFKGPSPIESLFKWNISYLWHVVWSLCICRASCDYCCGKFGLNLNILALTESQGNSILQYLSKDRLQYLLVAQ